MYVDFNQIARIGKLIALLGFFLPWVTVSCSNTEILNATGWQLMIGDPQPAGALEGMAQNQQTDDAEPAVVVIVAFAVFALGLIASLLLRARAAAGAMLAAALLGMGVSYAGVENMRNEMRREITESQGAQGAGADSPFFSAAQQREMSEAMASSITVKEEEGYFVTLGGAALAALFALLTLFVRRKPEAAPEAP